MPLELLLDDNQDPALDLWSPAPDYDEQWYGPDYEGVYYDPDGYYDLSVDDMVWAEGRWLDPQSNAKPHLNPSLGSQPGRIRAFGLRQLQP